eukprot:jgi/Mesvir1/8643/Mv02588-RA.1
MVDASTAATGDSPAAAPAAGVPENAVAGVPATGAPSAGAPSAGVPDLPENVVASRSGSVLGKQTILKSDHFPGCHNKRIVPHLDGAPNFRKVAGVPVYGVAIPTVGGIRAVLHSVGIYPNSEHPRLMWHNMREEPVLYVNGRPFVLREVERPFSNLEYTGINTERVEQMEARMKEDVLREAQLYNGSILVSDESSDGQMLDIWEHLGDENAVQTPQEVYASLVAEGYPVDYCRVPVTDEKAPKERDFDALVDRLRDRDPHMPLVFNCQMGRGRTTTAMIIACLILLKKNPDEAKQWLLEAGSETDAHNTVAGPDDALRRGEYTVIRSLLRVLEGAAESRRIVDITIDRCAAMQNIREAILQYRNGVQTQTEERKRESMLRFFVEYLERYYYLIAFSSYLWSEKKGELPEVPFEQWMASRPEMYSILRRLVRRDPIKALSYPCLSLEQVSESSPTHSRHESPTHAAMGGGTTGAGGYGPEAMPPVPRHRVSMEDFNAVLAGRTGAVLGPLTILKGDHFPRCQNTGLLQRVPGAPNFRQVPDTPVYGLAMPTIEGMRAVLDRVLAPDTGNTRAVWINLREEPVVYVNGTPLVLREVERPFKNMREYRGIGADRMQQMEARLKADILAEARQHGDRIMVSQETPDAHMHYEWQEVSRPDAVLTPQEVFAQFAANGVPVAYARFPMTDGKAPSLKYFDAISQYMFQEATGNTAIICNCQMGKGRTTTALVVACLSLLHMGRLDPRSFAQRRSGHLDVSRRNSLDLPPGLLAQGGAGGGPSASSSSIAAAAAAALTGGLEADRDTFDEFRSGEFSAVRRLTRTLQAGPEMKRLVDAVVDKCDEMQNLREAITDYWQELGKPVMEDRERWPELNRAVEYLERYCMLISFAAYLHSQCPPAPLYPHYHYHNQQHNPPHQPPQQHLVGAGHTEHEQTFRQWMSQWEEIKDVKREMRHNPLGVFHVPGARMGPIDSVQPMMRSGAVLGRMTILKRYDMPVRQPQLASANAPGLFSFNFAGTGYPPPGAVAGLPPPGSAAGVAPPTAGKSGTAEAHASGKGDDNASAGIPCMPGSGGEMAASNAVAIRGSLSAALGAAGAHGGVMGGIAGGIAGGIGGLSGGGGGGGFSPLDMPSAGGEGDIAEGGLILLPGAPRLCKVEGFRVYGMATPTMEGMEEVLRWLGCGPVPDGGSSSNTPVQPQRESRSSGEGMEDMVLEEEEEEGAAAAPADSGMHAPGNMLGSGGRVGASGAGSGDGDSNITTNNTDGSNSGGVDALAHKAAALGLGGAAGSVTAGRGGQTARQASMDGPGSSLSAASALPASSSRAAGAESPVGGGQPSAGTGMPQGASVAGVAGATAGALRVGGAENDTGDGSGATPPLLSCSAATGGESSSRPRCRAVLIDLREETVVYIGGKPYVLRELERPSQTLKNVGIGGDVVEMMEARLKDDILAEAACCGGRVLLHREADCSRQEPRLSSDDAYAGSAPAVPPGPSALSTSSSSTPMASAPSATPTATPTKAPGWGASLGTGATGAGGYPTPGGGQGQVHGMQAGSLASASPMPGGLGADHHAHAAIPTQFHGGPAGTASNVHGHAGPSTGTYAPGSEAGAAFGSLTSSPALHHHRSLNHQHSSNWNQAGRSDGRPSSSTSSAGGGSSPPVGLGLGSLGSGSIGADARAEAEAAAAVADAGAGPLASATKRGRKAGPCTDVISYWRPVTSDSVLTPLEVAEALQRRGYRLTYARIPSTTERQPEADDVDLIKDVILGHAGRGRLSMGGGAWRNSLGSGTGSLGASYGSNSGVGGGGSSVDAAASKSASSQGGGGGYRHSLDDSGRGAAVMASADAGGVGCGDPNASANCVKYIFMSHTGVGSISYSMSIAVCCLLRESRGWAASGRPSAPPSPTDSPYFHTMMQWGASRGGSGGLATVAAAMGGKPGLAPSRSANSIGPSKPPVVVGFPETLSLPNIAEAATGGGLPPPPGVGAVSGGMVRGTTLSSIMSSALAVEEGSALSGAGSPVLRQQMSRGPDFRRGEFRDILSLMRVLDHGQMAKADVDHVLDLCSMAGNVRQDVFDSKQLLEADDATRTQARSLTAKDPQGKLEEVQSYVKMRGEKSLRRYFFLIAFRSYMHEVRTGQTRATEKFETWMNNRKELSHLLQHLRL